MCGILVSKNFVRNKNEFESLLKTLEKRGPDASSIEELGETLLGHTRLTIIDTNERSNQPLRDESGRYSIVYNGEVYNYIELRKELELEGVKFHTESDTEVLLNWVIHKGMSNIDKLNGMFAFVIHDKETDELLIARDRYGIKPLYYIHNENGITFSSQISTLKGFSTGVDLNSKILFSGFGHIPEPYTLYKNVKSFEPGAYATYKNNKLSLQTYFSIFQEQTEKNVDLKSTISHAVNIFNRSDAPLGSFLSGGVDSSILSSMLTKENKNLRTVSINFEFGNLNEKEYQDMVIKDYPHENICEFISFDEFTKYKEEYDQIMEQPSIDGLNSFIASNVAKKNGLKVMVSGVGGDELFYGYPSFERYEKIKSISSLLPSFLIGFLPAKFKRFEYAKINKTVGSYYVQRSINSPSEVSNILGINIKEVEKVFKDFFCTVEKKINSNDENLISKLEISEYMKNQLLRDSDVYSMYNSIEIRIPFLDNDLVNRTLSLSPVQKITTPKKKLLIENSSTKLNEGLVVRPKKGFELPFAYFYKRTGNQEDAHWSKIRVKELLQKFDNYNE
ncbi:MAG: asparagine synthase (glutamine-hydrolyzing) [Bacteriovorax sp. MedPE-SWde]|nr:MAG: asparagine synthase (glutamine-hydrolyzing) [Bacteriovorax sp. MedPE-SWde]